MPIHDWTRVSAGTWHDFHNSWIAEIRRVLNSGLLPSEYYAQSEQIIGNMGPDLLALRVQNGTSVNGVHSEADPASAMGVAVAVAPPLPKLVSEVELAEYTRRRRTVAIRHSSDDEIVALIEIVSPGNKSSQRRFEAFVDKAAESIERGFHLLVVDLFPPTVRDPRGIHAAIWDEIEGAEFVPPADSPLTLVAYSCGSPIRAYIEPTAVGRELLEMPLFLEPEIYVNVPLEATYRASFVGLPRKWKDVLEAPPS